jgi:dethiobiotin synthetase
MRKLFISGTDTGIGKTYYCGLLCKYLLDKGESICYVKPVQTGYPEDDDRQTVIDMSGIKPEHAYTLNTAKFPAAPFLAFDDFPYENTIKKINEINGFDWLIVESAGGLMVPLDEGYMNFDIARDCGLETVIVVPNRLGCINHAMLNYYFLEKENLPFTGFAVNEHFAAAKSDKFNISILNDLTNDAVRSVFSDVMEFVEF